MINWLKYTIIGILIVLVMLFIVIVSTKHQTNITGTQTVDPALKSSEVGSTRNSDNRVSMTKKSIISNLVSDIAKEHNQQDKDIEVEYVFYDKNGNITNNENNVASVQFEVFLIGKNDRVESVSRQHIILDDL